MIVAVEDAFGQEKAIDSVDKLPHKEMLPVRDTLDHPPQFDQ